MDTPIRLEDIYDLFRASQEDLLRSRQEFDRRTEEFNRRSAEADQRAAEADQRAAQRAAEADQRAAQRAAEADQRAAEADQRAAEADQRAAEADRRLAQLEQTVGRTAKAVDALTTRWGRFVESLVEPAVVQLFQDRGIDVKEIYPRARTKRPGLAMEIDILAVNETEVVLVECKSRLSQDDVDEFMAKLTRFKQSFPHYQTYLVYGAVAGIEINEGVDRYASKKGLFVIQPTGDTVAIINSAEFQPRTW
ncbi:hypothetical protein GlitD10_0150 [Gloeomargarita lithophora Alchichica-D10]|uniref:DUF3782 domain-containing protein n=1 Tax=Gloeomargarita lithophora Alchichica-D10 TaxID=1188229 RepID=A0A1J0A947_9CYAN|nr:DUF3782 domain-containing protein [Gloeomargarita lithophora]APB32451.1 hypothetical protein GlitD10_0150 [Gloeomargarita lithophora Alchichica-D10]